MHSYYFIDIHNTYLIVIGVHEMRGQMHPNYYASHAPQLLSDTVNREYFVSKIFHAIIFCVK